MAFDIAPNQWIASWSEDGTTVSFDIADVPGLTAAEADAATGDSRACIMRLMDLWFTYVDGQASGDAPTQAEVSRTLTSGTVNGNVQRRYNHSFQSQLDTYSVVPE